MEEMPSTLINLCKTLLLALVLVVPSTGWSNTLEEVPSPLAMTGDAIFVRPVMIGVTILGAAVFIISSPFSALGGNIDESWDQLVVGPFQTTFVRCLGCTMNGRKASSVVKQNDKNEKTEEPTVIRKNENTK
jgi:hypothetical protein